MGTLKNNSKRFKFIRYLVILAIKPLMLVHMYLLFMYFNDVLDAIFDSHLRCVHIQFFTLQRRNFKIWVREQNRMRHFIISLSQKHIVYACW